MALTIFEATSSRPRHENQGAWDVERGGESPPVNFRDPPLAEEARSLREEIASALAGVPHLPAEIPQLGLTLVDLEVGDKEFALVFGKPDPMARVRLRAATDSPDLTPLRLPTGRPAFVTVHTEFVHPSARHLEAQLRQISLRLSASINEAKWSAALAVQKRLQRLPLDVPIAHFRQLVPGQSIPSGLVRVGFGCNQDCGMCWQNRDWGRFSADQVVRWIEDIRSAGAIHLSISGGEPTLDSELERYVRTARSLGFQTIVVQTNAVQFAKAGYAERMAAAGLHEAFVSLHSGDPRVSDSVTRAPGTHVRTVQGIHRLLEHGIVVTLNCVMTEESLATLADLPQFISAEFGRHPRLRGVVLSLPTAPFDPKLLPMIVPDPVHLRAELPKAINRALALGVALQDLEGPCGPPLCAFGADPRITPLRPLPAHVNFRHYLPACATCAVQDACFGLRPEQTARYGDACVAPIKTRPSLTVIRK